MLTLLFFIDSFLITGKPTVKISQTSADAAENGSVTYSCTGTSTTFPRDNSLGFSYQWFIDGGSVEGSRFQFTDNSMRIKDITRNDQNKTVSCKATENDGLTSNESSREFINVRCK